MDQAVIKIYRNLLKENFPNAAELENPTLFIEAVGHNKMSCGKAGSYMQLYLQIDEDIITEIKYQCICEPAANVAVEVLCQLARGKTIEQAMSITEDPFCDIIGSTEEEVYKKVRELLALLREGLTSYLHKEA